MKTICFKTFPFLIAFLLLFPIRLVAQEESKTYVLTWEDMMALKVTSASMAEEALTDAPSNITVITKEMIENRGYRTFVEVAQDIPGFDFLMYEDGAGEFSTFSIHRGTGGQGNSRILIMVDNIPQNFINNLWSVHWTFEQLLHDLDRIEIIHGPGSALYGAQAFTGVVHFITKNSYEGVYAKTIYGSHNEVDLQLLLGKKVTDDFHISLAFRKYHNDGDKGLVRPDPGNYFHNNIAPDTLTQHYDEDGVYHTMYPNPSAGKKIPDGFNNWVNTYSFRLKLSWKKTETGVFFWDLDRGSSSYIAGYEYYLRHEDHRCGMRGMHIYTRNNQQINDRISLETDFVGRTVWRMPETGVQYTFRFDGMTKYFFSSGYQAYIEEKLKIKIKENNHIIVGGRFLYNINSLSNEAINVKPSLNSSQIESSWNIAATGGSLNQTEERVLSFMHEIAVYTLWNNKINDYFAYSLGSRMDYSTGFGMIHNPRAAFIIKPTQKMNIKLLYGHAFRQPSTFDESSNYPSGNQYGTRSQITNLESEKARTSELEINVLTGKRASIKANIFYSDMYDLIQLIPDTTAFFGIRAANIAQYITKGVSLGVDCSPHENVRLYANYMFTQGKDPAEGWQEIEKIAAHKINMGVNWLLWKNRINLNIRANIVGKRKAQAENKWLQKYENGYAPAYQKINMTITYRDFKKIHPQFIVRNLLNEQFYGVGRNIGSALREEYDPHTNFNADGYVPSYHPQPGRTFTFLLKYEF